MNSIEARILSLVVESKALEAETKAMEVHNLNSDSQYTEDSFWPIANRQRQIAEEIKAYSMSLS